MSVSNKYKQYTDILEKIHELVDDESTMKNSLEIMIDSLYKKNKETKELKKQIKELQDRLLIDEDRLKSAFNLGYNTAIQDKTEDKLIDESIG